MQQIRVKIYPYYLFLLLLCFGCSKAPHIPGIDSAAWKADYKGCNSYRIAQLPVLKSKEHQLKGLNEMEIVAIFGKPDRVDLRGRNQNYYWYYLEAGPHCTGLGRNNAINYDPNIKPLIMKLRFNAVDLVNEITYSN